VRALVRRVSKASVKVEGQIVGQIDQGLLVYLGVHQKDEWTDVDWLIQKILGLRIFEDEHGKMNLSILPEQGVLLISQFTLFGNLKKGYRPSFNRAADPKKGEELFDLFYSKLRILFEGNLASGVFGADMKIEAIDDGPVTIWIDSQERNY
jgi:D-tyrosyl-tRNA(Tyr) deacylase